MSGDSIASCAESWVGVPFLWQGRIRAGCDCKGLVAGVARECNRPEADSLEALAGDYGAVVDAARLRAGLARLFDRVTERQPGDVLLIRIHGKAQHLSIAAPLPGKASRVIEALDAGPRQVRPFRRSEAETDSIWRWRRVD